MSLNSFDELVLGGLSVANRKDQTNVYGIVALVGGIPDGFAPPSAVTVDAGLVRSSFEADQCIRLEGNSWRVTIHVVTHLIPDGPVCVRVRLHWPDGLSAAFLDKQLVVDNSSDLAKAVRRDLIAFHTPPILPRVVDSAYFPYTSGACRAWFDEISPSDVPLCLDQSSDIEEAHRHLERWGFCILPERLPQDLISDFLQELKEAMESGRLPYEEGSSQRIHGAHLLPHGRKIWLFPPVMRFLRAHFRDDPCACQTLTYIHGSEQDAHQDTIHLTPYPAGYMCGVWIALEDVQTDSGELFVYPGSHKTQRLLANPLGLAKVDVDYSSYVVFANEIARLLEDGGYQQIIYRPKAGQILVWHENLIHGGSRRLDRSKTRLSIVSHYFAKGSLAYYDSRGEAATLETLPEAVS